MLYPDLTTSQSALNATWQWPHFSIPELSCRCGRYCAGAYWHDAAFLTALEALRASLSRPLIINSGHHGLFETSDSSPEGSSVTLTHNSHRPAVSRTMMTWPTMK